MRRASNSSKRSRSVRADLSALMKTAMGIPSIPNPIKMTPDVSRGFGSDLFFLYCLNWLAPRAIMPAPKPDRMINSGRLPCAYLDMVSVKLLTVGASVYRNTTVSNPVFWKLGIRTVVKWRSRMTLLAIMMAARSGPKMWFRYS